MKPSQTAPDKPDTNEVDDLTRFLDEDFGTEDVNLFEFTSEEDSPLTQLKSIILSLDWEISDETLHDLTEEISHLKQLETFQNDKVSQVYLQGLDKIGRYIQSEGAYAHPNSIKLLLTLYYDFEKILSSEHITGAEITALLKSDVRKFKILQHQIAQKHGASAAAEEVGAPLPLTEHKDLQGIQAAILELDWEVTDAGLKNLADHLDILKDRYAEDRYIKVVIQGLHSLNTYIIEEKGRAHPETFSLLHTFYDALETLIEQGDLDEEKKQEILIDSVNRLNHLKHLIAQTYPREIVAAEAITPVSEPEEAPAEEVPTKPEAPAAPPPRAQAPTAAEEDLDEIAIFGTDMDEHRELAPALADSEEERGFGPTAEAEAPPEELAEKLDFFFGEEKEEFAPESIEQAVAQQAEAQQAPEPEPPPAAEEITPALAGSFEDRGFATEEEAQQAPPQELAEKLDFFFGEEEKPAAEPAALAEPFAEPEPALAGEPEEEPLAGFADEEVAPALADEGEEVGFGGQGAQLDAPPAELAEKLDFFFGGEEEAEAPAAEPVAFEEPAAPAEEPAIAFTAETEEETAETIAPAEEEPALTFAEEEMTPALADSGEEGGFTGGERGMEAPPAELAEKLDFFFGGEEAPAPPMPAAEAEEEEVLLTPALAAAEELEQPPLEEIAAAPAAAASLPAEYQAVFDQMRADYKAMEASLRLQIEELRREVQKLQARVQ